MFFELSALSFFELRLREVGKIPLPSDNIIMNFHAIVLHYAVISIMQENRVKFLLV
jgi:hypothetical protein